ncbi:MAG: restriction endonuclease subunit S [Flavobacteriales bacterium]|nr:restriction endonuclease subunit S [Flavobacteriales bacterium]
MARTLVERGGSPRPIQNFLTTDPNGLNWIKIGDATASDKYIYETKEKIRPEGLKKSRFVEVDDFLLSNSMSFGRPYIMKTTGCIHDGWLVLKQKERVFDQDFLYHLLSSRYVFDQFDTLAAGSTEPQPEPQLVSRVVVHYPGLTEQRRIAEGIGELYAETKKLETTYQQKQTELAGLKNAVLGAAFRGIVNTE